ncbi:MAG: hypothetical protein ACKN9U_07730, partial [Pirellulaceae bacterium]
TAWPRWLRGSGVYAVFIQGEASCSLAVATIARWWNFGLDGFAQPSTAWPRWLPRRRRVEYNDC